MRENRSTLSITTRDVGLTQIASVWIGSTRIVEFWTHTRHEDRSLEIADEIVASALKPLIESTVRDSGGVQLWLGEPGGDNYDMGR